MVYTDWEPEPPLTMQVTRTPQIELSMALSSAAALRPEEKMVVVETCITATPDTERTRRRRAILFVTAAA